MKSLAAKLNLGLPQNFEVPILGNESSSRTTKLNLDFASRFLSAEIK